MIVHEVVFRPSYSRVCGKAETFVFGKPLNFRNFLENQDLLGHVAFFARGHGVTDLFLPNASNFNAKVAESADQFPQKRVVEGVSVFSGCYVDGMKISKGQAFFVASGDCPTLIFSSPNKDYVIACHAGRNSLIDVGRIFHTGRVRTHQSVVDRALEFFRGDEAHVSIEVVCGIGAQHFAHSTLPVMRGVPNEHAEKNRLLVKYIFDVWGGECFGVIRLEPYLNGQGKELLRPVRPASLEECADGKIDLCALVREQAAKHEVPKEKVRHDGVCTYHDGHRTTRTGHYWSNRRGEEGRNGVLVVMR